MPGLKNVVADFLSCPLPKFTETVTATVAADLVDLEEMDAEQNRCAETQRLLGSTSLKLACRQTGAQCLAGDISKNDKNSTRKWRNKKTNEFKIEFFGSHC